MPWVPDNHPLIPRGFKPRTIKTHNGEMIVKLLGRGKGMYVEVQSMVGGLAHSITECITPTKARRLAEALHAAADHLDGGIQVVRREAKCRCGSRRDLKMVQHRHGHNRAQLGWDAPVPLCPVCCQKDRGIFRYCPTK